MEQQVYAGETNETHLWYEKYGFIKVYFYFFLLLLSFFVIVVEFDVRSAIFSIWRFDKLNR